MQTASRISFSCLTSLIGLAAFVLSANAQQAQPPSQCPSVSVSCPGCPTANEDIKFIASITGDKFDGLTIKWSTSQGKIIDGQGTPALIVKPDNKCESLTATVEVYGVPGCPLIASCSLSTHCCGSIPLAQKFDEYGDVSCEGERKHLAGFNQQLDNQPGATGYIIFYGGRSYGGRLPRLGESEARAKRLRIHSRLNNWIDLGRVMVINGGYRETWTVELWIVPAGSVPPEPTPQIDAKAIKFRPGAVRKDEYKCP